MSDSLRRYPDTRVRVVGHTDNVGGAYNAQFSKDRARAVACELIVTGADAARIVVSGRGIVAMSTDRKGPIASFRRGRSAVLATPSKTAPSPAPVSPLAQPARPE